MRHASAAFWHPERRRSEAASSPTHRLWCESDWTCFCTSVKFIDVHVCHQTYFAPSSSPDPQFPVVFFTSLMCLIDWCDLHSDYAGMLSERGQRPRGGLPTTPGVINCGKRVETQVELWSWLSPCLTLAILPEALSPICCVFCLILTTHRECFSSVWLCTAVRSESTGDAF